MFRLFKKKAPVKWREFVCYIEPFMATSELAREIIQRANDLGLQGKRVTVVNRMNKERPADDEIWFEGEMK